MRKLLLCLVPILFPVATARAADTLRLDAATAVELALRNNHQLAQARARLDEAVAGQGAAFGAFLPQVSAGATYTRLAKANELTMLSARDSIMTVPVFDPQGNYLGQTGVPVRVPVGVDTFNLRLGSVNNYAVTGTVQQTLFTWGKLINAYRIAGLSLNLQKEAAAQARAQVKVEATQNFYHALLARKTSEVMNDAFRQLERHVAQVQSLYDNGLATRLDLMKARLGLQQLETQVSQVASGAELTIAALLNTLGLDPGTPVALNEELAPDSATADPDRAVEQALARRPELAQLRDAVRIADLGVRIARTASLPNAFVQANASYRNPVGFSTEWGGDWNATAGVTMPVFTGLSNLRRLQAAQARYRQAQVALAMVEDGMRLEARAQALALNQEARNVSYQKRNVELAEAALELAEVRYENGLLTNLEYMDSHLALTQSRVAHLNAQANYQVARAKLEKAIGED